MLLRALMASAFMAAALAGAAPAATVQSAISVLPPAEVASNLANRLTLELSNGGRVVILLRPDAAPAHVARIQALVRRGFYNGLRFHRVIPGFMAQGGDPHLARRAVAIDDDLPAVFEFDLEDAAVLQLEISIQLGRFQSLHDGGQGLRRAGFEFAFVHGVAC